MTPQPPWKPSRREQRLFWWIKLVNRMIGGAGVMYTTLLHADPIGMLVFGAMATSMDMGQFVVLLFRAARDEAREIERIAAQEEPPSQD